MSISSFRTQRELELRLASLLRQHVITLSCMLSIRKTPQYKQSKDKDGRTFYYVEGDANSSTYEQKVNLFPSESLAAKQDASYQVDYVLQLLSDTIRAMTTEIRAYVQFIAKKRAERMNEIPELKNDESEAARKQLIESLKSNKELGADVETAIRNLDLILVEWNKDLINIVVRSAPFDKAKWIPLWARIFCNTQVQAGSISKKLNVLTGAKDDEEDVSVTCRDQVSFALQTYMQSVEQHAASVSSTNVLPNDTVMAAASNLALALSYWSTQTILSG